MEQGLLAAGLGTLCAVCGYYIGRGNLRKAMEDATEIKKFHNWEELGWPGLKAIVESLKAVA